MEVRIEEPLVFVWGTNWERLCWEKETSLDIVIPSGYQSQEYMVTLGTTIATTVGPLLVTYLVWAQNR